MPKTTRDITKSGKRPNQTGEPVLVRFQPPQVEKIDSWRRNQDDIPSRAEAIRRLVVRGLAAESKTRKGK